MALIGGSVSEAALRCFLSWGRISGKVSACLTLLIFLAAAAPLMPFASLRVAVLRARLSEDGGDCDVSDADGFSCVRDFEGLMALDTRVFVSRALRDEVREGALGLEASMEACERLLRVGMWKSG